MDELVKLVAAKTGLSEDLARTAVVTVVNFLKERLPEPIAAQVDNLLGGSAATKSGGAGDLLSGLGSLFGKK